jgi:hypothetical protein
MARRAAEQPKATDLSPDSIVEQLHPDTEITEAAVTLTGYLGPSSTDDNVRLYSNLSFTSYYEIPKDGILGRAKADPKDEDSATVLRVKSDTRLDIVNSTRRTIEANALSGSITGNYLSTAQFQAGGAGIQGLTSDPNVCTTVVCGTISTFICAQGAGRGPGIQGGVTSDPNVCTTVVCATISAFICAQGAGRGPAVQGGFTDPGCCTGPPWCPTTIVCAQGAR